MYAIEHVLRKLKELLDDNNKEEACRYVNNMIESFESDSFEGDQIILKDFATECGRRLSIVLKTLYMEGVNDVHVNPILADEKVIMHVVVEMSESKAAEIETRLNVLFSGMEDEIEDDA